MMYRDGSPCNAASQSETLHRRVSARGLQAADAVSKLLTNNLRGVEKRSRNLPSFSAYLRGRKSFSGILRIPEEDIQKRVEMGSVLSFYLSL